MVIEAANIAIRSLLLISGGASAALLAFVGAVEGRNLELNSELLAEPIRQLALCVGLVVVSAIFEYPGEQSRRGQYRIKETDLEASMR